MSFLRHLFVVLMYATAAVAVSTPRLLPGIDIQTGLILGGVVLLCCALLHEVFARQIQQATSRMKFTTYGKARTRSGGN